MEYKTPSDICFAQNSCLKQFFWTMTKLSLCLFYHRGQYSVNGFVLLLFSESFSYIVIQT